MRVGQLLLLQRDRESRSENLKEVVGGAKKSWFLESGKASQRESSQLPRIGSSSIPPYGATETSLPHLLKNMVSQLPQPDFTLDFTTEME